MRKVSLKIIIVLMFLIVVGEGLYTIFRIQKAGYGISRMLIHRGNERPLGVLLFCYEDEEFQSLKKIIYLERGFPLDFKKIKVPGPEIPVWKFSCRIMAFLNVGEDTVIDQMVFRSKDGYTVFLDGKNVADFRDNTSWVPNIIQDINLKEGLHSLEIRLWVRTFGGYMDVQWRKKDDAMPYSISLDRLVPGIPVNFSHDLSNHDKTEK